MKKTFLLILFSICNNLLAQIPIDISEQTIKIATLSEEILYFGFTEGDQIIFSLIEINSKEIKEVEIIEYPSTSKFSDFKTSKIENKIITVNSKAVYKFRFYNSSLAARICKIKIQRIPNDEESKKFNSSIKWVTKQDTIWNTYTKDEIIKYDTLKIQKKRKILDFEEKYEEMIMEKSQRVHSQTNSNGNKTSVFFSLPQDQLSDYETKKVLAWAYWIGVDEKSNIAWQENRKLIINGAKTLATAYYSPLGAYAVGAISNLIIPSSGESVNYALVDEANRNLFNSGFQYKGYDFGKGTAGFKKFTDGTILQGTYFFVLSNDNKFQGIDANIKVSAIIEHKKYKEELYTENEIKPVYEKKIIKEPIINTHKFPATFDYKQ